MECPKCGAAARDGDCFCMVCGAKLTGDEECQAGSPTTDMSSSETASSATVSKESGNSRKKIWIGAGIAAAAIFAVIVAVGLASLLTRSGGKNACVCLVNGRYELLTSLRENQSVEIESSRTSDVTEYLLSFSPDGRYVYYYTKYDHEAQTGSLCRAEYGKLRANSDKNSRYVEIVATNVALGFRILDDGTVTYQNSEGSLYYFDGREAVRVAKNVQSYYTDGSERVVYVTRKEEDKYDLYGVTFRDVNREMKLAANIARVTNVVDLDNILFTKEEDDGTETLYAVGFEKEVQKLGSRIKIVTSVGAKTYFTAENGRTLSLYDFVDDPKAYADAAAIQPQRGDYETPKYQYHYLYRGSDADQALYSSCTRANLFFRDSIASVAGQEAYQSCNDFVEKYKSQEDANGYFLVTDEVKEDIQALAAEYGQGGEGEWLELCFSRQESGVTFDHDAYQEDLRQWQEAENRNNARERLQNSEATCPIYTLYRFEAGTVTAINETVLNVRAYEGAVMFNTPELITTKIPLEQAASSYQSGELFDLGCGSENYLVLTESDELCQMSADATEVFADAYADYGAKLFLSEREAFLNDKDGVLSVAAIRDGIVGKLEPLDDDAKALTLEGNTLYYLSCPYQNNGETYGDLYTYCEGKGNRLARDVMPDSVRVYDDGVVLAYTGFRNNGDYELSMFYASGETTLIGDSVSRFVRADRNTLLYISDGDLYCYDGREKNLVRMNTEMFWCKNAMEPTYMSKYVQYFPF